MALTQKQETFCQRYIETGNATEAYRLTYNPDVAPEAAAAHGSRLIRNDKVKARLAELRKPAAEAAQMTLEGHLARLRELSEAAQAAGQLSAAITAEVARGKASGVHVERSESLVTTRELPASVDDFV